MLPFTTVSLSSSTSSLNYRLYPSRFYVLFVFCFLAFNQCLFWLTFSPISQSTQKYYRVNESTVNLLLNWGPIIFIPFLPLTYILLNKENGFQKTVRILAWTCFLAAAVRLLPSYIPWERNPGDKSFAVLCIHLGQILNAACGPLVMAPVSQLSCLWFGSNERTRATTVAIMAASLGSTVAFVISPWIVAQPEDIVKLLHIHFILASIAFVLALIYLPGQPPSPPSLAAQSLIENAINEQHQNSFGNYLNHVGQCFQNRSFVYLCSIGGLLSGAFAAWTSLFANTLAPENFTEQQAGWLGFSASLAAIVGGLLSSVLADSHQFRQSFKLIIVTTLICCFLSLFWFQLSVRTIFFDYPILQPSLLSITLCVALTGFFQGSSLPLIYEALAETMFPLPESLSASVLVQLTNVTALILIFIPPNYYKLMNFSVILLVAICILMASLVQIDYRRRNEEERKQ